jgi:hypothetical protein
MADALVRANDESRPESAPQLDAAKKFPEEFLGDGPRPAKNVIANAKLKHMSQSSAERAARIVRARRCTR